MYLQENEVTIKKLVEIFTGAFMDVSDVEESRLNVKGVDFPFPLRVSLDTEQKAIRFADFNRLHRITEKNAALLCNDINKTIVLGRFYAMTVNDLVLSACEYEMTFKNGLMPYQVMANFRLFEKIAGHGVRNHFVDYLKS
jgi:hypothetical protein